ncbi:LOW QUALITY PROTEIN: TPR and ankyrin repeat-containing protein 1-like [Dendronephthya gigantea]|uniref:LOW QUALITY PROTEIN: TPR and ankyrin repeat-containing protein 1-like n=1 Tax=Dendronephthya gigantea TaxID=151771 RepID=UPI0010693828|nr:LOW QUALITY PROTEIN: TPR and ankyrin repeat-containing protein 1-like [Dendronephthya gigantea]
MDNVISAYQCGLKEQHQGNLKQAINHFTVALEYFHDVAGRNYDLIFWSNILLARSDCYIKSEQYDLATKDVKEALLDCPEQLCDFEDANLWLQHGRTVSLPVLAIWCYSAALHFSEGDNGFQSRIYSYRAWSHYDNEDHEECEKDIEESKRLDFGPPMDVGRDIMNQGMEMIRTEKYDRAVHLLQLAENYFRPLDHLNQVDESVKLLQRSWKGLIYAAWHDKVHEKAIETGKRRQQAKPITSKEEANEWKKKGNEMFKEEKFDNAIDCYTLSIQYVPDGDDVLRGTLYSNRSQAYLKKKQYMKSKEDAEKCLKYRPNWGKSFYRLGSALSELKEYERALDVFRKSLTLKTTTEEDKDNIVDKIMTIAYKYGPMKVNFELPRDCLNRYMKECVENDYWKSVEVLLLGGGGQRSYAKGRGGIATRICDLSDISLCDVIKSDPKPIKYHELISVMIENGVLVNGRDEQDIPVALAVNYDDHDLAVILLKKNANPDGLVKCKFGKRDDMPIHSAFRIGLSSGNWKIFNYLMENWASTATATPYPKTLDKNGNNLYHLVATGDCRELHRVVEGIGLLRKYKVDPRTRNQDGKTPLMMIRQNNDPRYRLIEESVKDFAPKNSKEKKRDVSVNRNSERVPNQILNKYKKARDAKQLVTKTVEKVPVSTVHCPTEMERLREKIIQAIECLPAKMDSENKIKNAECSEMEDTEENQEIDQNTASCSSHFKAISHQQFDTKTCDETFDKLTWEVQCTYDVLKKLKEKKIPRDMKRKIVTIIRQLKFMSSRQPVRQLANGRMRGSLAKRLVGIASHSDILLFEAKLDKSARIIWERAIAFSPRCSVSNRKNENNGGIYTEVIRIWDIVFDHDTVPRKIKSIVRSYERGENCFIRKSLKGVSVGNSASSTADNQRSIPKLYVPEEDQKQMATEHLTSIDNSCNPDESTKMFFPPGSLEETEYHILKFYAFSNAVVDAILDNEITSDFDFPFCVSELEHSVINLSQKQRASIILLGRSGTGKTTCCLYRLWNNYQRYWQLNKFSEPSIPNVAKFIPQIADGINHNTGNEEQCRNKRPMFKEGGDFCSISYLSGESEAPKTMEKCASQGPSCRNDGKEDLQSGEKEQTLEHLHQAFITKNKVLCEEVQKNFSLMSKACFFTRRDVNHQQSSQKYTFDQVEEQAWPLFICSRDWLLMLDASLPGEQFFRRNKDGKLERNVRGWAGEDNNLHGIPEDIKYHDAVKNKPTAADSGHKEQLGRGKLDHRREVTYEVFKNELWRKMTKKRDEDYHPSLVWTEIISFIKGSVEALHNDCGYVTLEEYQKLGNKRAPSFTANRTTIYKLFLAYQHILRSQEMFDEADVVHNIYHRLERHVPTWSIHEIYVDETQDFTQAELSLIIRSCRNPNRLFFTGDTAQSVMRGIAFRFSDLRSLFHYMRESLESKGQKADVIVPDKVYQLTHNYRSHAGILNLASSVTDLLSHFFPESFDRMARDQGLFDGPKPVLLESCSFSDLADILRGHKRKTSPIEFGAHQVILVASVEVRNSLPEELRLARALVMTIYEAKGLEFDDVLIYNFFKDSQALKEWRIVGTYKERTDKDSNTNSSGIAEEMVENMAYKARPLEFNPDQHKILISEFKSLYTALTRARVNVWLFDENEEARAPMFEYFQKRGVVEVKRVQKKGDVASIGRTFAQKSGKDEWKKQGIFFYDKGRWKDAVKCFEMAKEDLWIKKCKAHEHVSKAATLTSEPRKLRLEFVKAADLFLECYMNDEAMKCLSSAEEHILLAKLHEKSGNFSVAAEIYRNEGKFRDAARNFMSARNFEGAVDSLLKVNRYNDVFKIISKYKDLVHRGEEHTITKPLRFDQRDEAICYQAAKFYQRRGDHRLMKDTLERLPDVKDHITFLKRNGCFNDAAQLLVKQGKLKEASNLMRSQGQFLEAARYSADEKFIAECYLLAARSTILTLKRKVRNGETEDLVEGLLERAAEVYNRCNDLNGKAEAEFTRGKFYDNSQDVEKAGNLFFEAGNYAALADCFLVLMNTNPESFSRAKAIDTLNGLLYLLHAFHKKKKGNKDRTAIAMCYEYFGLQDVDSTHDKKVPHLEMVRFAYLLKTSTKFSEDKIIPNDEVNKLIKDRLFQMARTLIEKVWNKTQRIIANCTPCPQFMSEINCDIATCKNHHSEETRQHFADRFYALLFLVHLEQIIGDFLKSMKRESEKVKTQLQKVLFIHPEFTACDQLYELLFPRKGNFVASYFLSERDVLFLRRKISNRIEEFAKVLWYSRSSEEERWTSSDLIIEVSNLLHLAGGSVDYLLSVEERKFEDRKLSNHTGMSQSKDGRFNIFSRALERSRFWLYSRGDVFLSIHAAVKQFLLAPAKRRGLPYSSIANSVMILERHLTACLMLHARLTMNDTIVCLPESYLSMISFWDFVDRPQTNQSITFNMAIQHALKCFQSAEPQRSFNHLHELSCSVVQLTLGKINSSYNILREAISSTSVHLVEVERVLVLVLTMLCNCGRGIPEGCNVHIREQLFTLQLRHDLPQKLKKCFEDARNANGFRDVVLCLRELLLQKPRQERLVDVKWDELRSKDCRINCRIDMYSKSFSFKSHASTISTKATAMAQVEEPEAVEDEMMYKFSRIFNEKESRSQRQEYSKEVKKNACLVISKAYLKWRSRKETKEKLDTEMKNDAVKRHFQSFKLDKYGCTICGRIQFVNRSLNVTVTTPSAEPSLSHEPDKEETWKQRILQRNTFEAHCSRGSPHWKKEKSFARFRDLYRRHFLPTIKKATQLLDEMTNLQEETEVDYSLDLDRLNDALSRLQMALKKVENSCSWNSVNMINKEVEVVNNLIRRMRNNTVKKGGLSIGST